MEKALKAPSEEKIISEVLHLIIYIKKIRIFLAIDIPLTMRNTATTIMINIKVRKGNTTSEDMTNLINILILVFGTAKISLSFGGAVIAVKKTDLAAITTIMKEVARKENTLIVRWKITIPTSTMVTLTVDMRICTLILIELPTLKPETIEAFK